MTGLEIGLALVVGLLIGLVVGLLGAGGSILTVPALMLGLGLSATAATGTSLVVVSIVSSVGLVTHAIAHRVDWRAGIGFAATGVPAAVAGGSVAVLISDTWLTISLVVLLMGTAVWMWWRERLEPPDEQPRDLRWSLIVPSGLAVGLLTGTLGVGGGFVVVPALAALLGLPIHLAIGTSQLVLAANALAGLAGRAGTGSVSVVIGLVFAGGGALGAVVASRLVGRMPSQRLSRLFAWLLVLVATGLAVDLLFA